MISVSAKNVAFRLAIGKQMIDKNTNRKAEAAASDAISKKLREYYDTLAEEAIPERFLDLLDKLDEADKAHGAQTRQGGDRNGN